MPIPQHSDRIPWPHRSAALALLLAIAGLAVPACAQGGDPFGLDSDPRLTVPRNQIRVGARKDGIPALADPKFISAAEATWLTAGDRVLGVTHGGVAKAYPTQILVWHEAVNDTIAGKPYLVTY